ncbi:MAG: monooxygenase [Actinomycetota bacterium]|nr:MAG: monooxygenase [Actinomycetota bacterium]
MSGSAARSPDPPELVTFDVWRISRAAVPRALLRVATGRRQLRRLPGVRFAKLLGTGPGTSFGAGGADVRRWAALVAWDRAQDADRADQQPALRGWNAMATERLRLRLRPLSSRGSWSGSEPFGSPAGAAGARRQPWQGPVVAVTRARVRPGRWREFAAAVPAVTTDLWSGGPRPLLAVAVGEAPVLLQGTVSIWASAEELVEFAHRRSAHRSVISATRDRAWYGEELFARFALDDVEGTFDGQPVRRP